eukprot:11610321-Alexandrium_andersonii.AAC.1
MASALVRETGRATSGLALLPPLPLCSRRRLGHARPRCSGSSGPTGRSTAPGWSAPIGWSMRYLGFGHGRPRRQPGCSG